MPLSSRYCYCVPAHNSIAKVPETAYVFIPGPPSLSITQISDVPNSTGYRNEEAAGEKGADTGGDSKAEKGERTRGRPWRGEPGSTTDPDAGGNSRRYGAMGSLKSIMMTPTLMSQGSGTAITPIIGIDLQMVVLQHTKTAI